MRLSRHTVVPRCDRLGFSLIELVLVLVIVAIMAGVAVPRFTGSNTRLRSAAVAQRIAADLAAARGRARSLSTSQTVIFNLVANTYELPGLQSLDRAASPYVVELSNEPYKATVVSADFAGAPQIIFDGYGHPDNGGSVVVRVGEVLKTIVVDPQTGMASVQ